MVKEKVIAILPAPSGLFKTYEGLNGEDAKDEVKFIVFTDDLVDSEKNGACTGVNIHCVSVADIQEGFALFGDYAETQHVNEEP